MMMLDVDSLNNLRLLPHVVMKRLTRLINNIGILIFFFIIPVSLVLIDDYIDRPVSDAIGSGVICSLFDYWKLPVLSA
jgi:hypothetical protein